MSDTSAPTTLAPTPQPRGDPGLVFQCLDLCDSQLRLALTTLQREPASVQRDTAVAHLREAQAHLRQCMLALLQPAGVPPPTVLDAETLAILGAVLTARGIPEP